jgi:hypothetical protein
VVAGRVVEAPDGFARQTRVDGNKRRRTLLIAAVGERLTDAERAVFTRLIGRVREPLRRVEEFVVVIGRRPADRSLPMGGRRARWPKRSASWVRPWPRSSTGAMVSSTAILPALRKVLNL